MEERRRPELRVVPPGPSWPEWIEQWVLPYLREPVLWPVLIAVLGHLVVAIVALELAVWRAASFESGALLAVLVALSVAGGVVEVRRFGRPGAVTVVLALTWLASLAGAWLAERTGVL